MRISMLLIPTWMAIVSPLAFASENLTEHLSFRSGAVNEVLIKQDGHELAIYGWSGEDTKSVEQLLLTHGRRDVLRAAKLLVDRGTKAIAPSRELYYLEKPTEFWNGFATSRFHDYAQQSTKVLAKPLAVHQWVKDGDEFQWRGLTFRVLETGAYTRGSVTYITQLDGKKIAFTGDLIYGDGKILDLYSLQDAIPEAQIRGYHGYGSRLAGLVSGLQKVAAEKPDLIVPARGPVIERPQESIDRLTKRVQSLYRNYLSTNALHWYFKEDRMRMCGERVLGKGADIELMPYSHHEKTPSWVYENATSRLLISDSGNGFLLDCGYQRVIDAVKELIDKGVVKKIDGIFVTHFHDDHTDMVQRAAEQFKCPVYATPEYKDVLERPDRYHLPAMTSNAISNVEAMKNGQVMKWHEFDLTFYFFPGQTYYHGALLAKKKNEKPIFFIGDAFAPSGIDDYCVLNRNLVHEDDGYLLCLQKLRDVKEDCWLVNEHIRYVFSFSKEEMDYLEKRYRQRVEILKELFPWDDPNYGIDEQWAVFNPYGVTLQKNAKVELSVQIINHSPVKRTFKITPRPQGGLELLDCEKSITLGPRQTGQLRVTVQAGGKTGNTLVTADVKSEGMEFRDWIECLVTVE
jgi:glyoxylase-like metal-dependent hydrolase (beta-lactamase superfamily II)